MVVPLGITRNLFREYGNKSKLSSLLEVKYIKFSRCSISNIWFTWTRNFCKTNESRRSILCLGSFTLALLVLPIIIVATREAQKAVPPSIGTSYGLGATKWQTVWYQVLPTSFGWYSHCNLGPSQEQLEKQLL